MLVQKIQYPSFREITHFFFSSSNPIKSLFAAKDKDDAPRQAQAPAASKMNRGMGWVRLNKGLIGPDPFAAATSYAEKKDLAFLIVDQDMIIRHTNAKAVQFLTLPSPEADGHVFDYFVMPNEKQLISITRDNGKPGVGRMSVRDNGNPDVPYYLIFIEDLARRPSPPPA